jgi:hypothetical protein
MSIRINIWSVDLPAVRAACAEDLRDVDLFTREGPLAVIRLLEDWDRFSMKLLADDWKADGYEFIAEECSDWDVQDQTKALLKMINWGRTPNLEPFPEDLAWMMEDAVCFLTDAEAKAVAADLRGCPSIDRYREMEPPQPTRREPFPKDLSIIPDYVENHLLPAIDAEIPEGRGFYFVTT